MKKHGKVHNRLQFIREKHPQAHYWISQEGGLYAEDTNFVSRAWIVIADDSGFVAESSTADFRLPCGVTKLINSGKELGDATDTFLAIKIQNNGMGAIGHITEGIINRTDYYLPAAIIALCQVKNKHWY